MSPLQPFQSRIIFLFVQQELLVAEIYRFFAGLFPDSRDFWEGAAREEMEHATWVEYFYRKTTNGDVRFQEDKIKTYTVESFIKYLQDNLAKMKEKAPTGRRQARAEHPGPCRPDEATSGRLHRVSSSSPRAKRRHGSTPRSWPRPLYALGASQQAGWHGGGRARAGTLRVQVSPPAADSALAAL